MGERISDLVEWLADGRAWNWTRLSSNRDAADCVLQKMAELKMIKKITHPYGGNAYLCDGRLFGRTDGITIDDFC